MTPIRSKSRPYRTAQPAGYSGTPLAKKLGFREGSRAALLHAPRGFRNLLEGLPAGVRFVNGSMPADLILSFATSVADLERDMQAAITRIPPAGMIWAAWPKKASGVATDLTEDRVRAVGLAAGLVDVKVCAIDATWSGLKFVRRLRDR